MVQAGTTLQRLPRAGRLPARAQADHHAGGELWGAVGTPALHPSPVAWAPDEGPCVPEGHAHEPARAVGLPVLSAVAQPAAAVRAPSRGGKGALGSPLQLGAAWGRQAGGDGSLPPPPTPGPSPSPTPAAGGASSARLRPLCSACTALKATCLLCNWRCCEWAGHERATPTSGWGETTMGWAGPLVGRGMGRPLPGVGGARWYHWLDGAGADHSHDWAGCCHWLSWA